MVGRLFQNSNVTFSFRLQTFIQDAYSIHSRPAIFIQAFNSTYSFKIKRTRDLLLIFANQCHVSGLGITLPLLRELIIVNPISC